MMMTPTASHTGRAPASVAALHVPVMLDRCLELLEPAIHIAPQNGGSPVIVDATLGLGGHSEALLQRFPQLTVIGLDRDTQALERATERLAPFGHRFQPVHAVFSDLAAVLRAAGVDRIHGALFDLGVSSMQLDHADRGFAYAQDAPLDMRMDQTTGETAADLLARSSEQDLARLFRVYGDEPLAARYARAIVRERDARAITRSGELVDLLQRATPAKLKSQRHPAKRVFQALRVAVNRELDAITVAVPAAMEHLALGGRIVVMSYQSHEDRLVKRVFAEATRSTAPSGLPMELPEHEARFTLLTRGAEKASDEEQHRNPRSIPVRLRAAERVKEAAL